MPPSLTLVHTVPASLDTLLMHHPSATYFVRVGIDKEAIICESAYFGVRTGDILTVDRSRSPTIGCLVLAVCAGELALCRYTEHEGKRFLVCGGKGKEPVEVTSPMKTDIWGVVSTLSRCL
ncbi:MAG: hypothetical protein KBD24_02680 [Candidatus Pacebacteria bacterium]|nr:hypothetical protein [Candidatus Paceibacterota bacterium]